MSKPPLFERPIIEVTVAAPADEVWHALRDPERIRDWFGWDADTLSAEIREIFVDGALADDAARRLAFKDGDDRYEVEARGASALVRVVRPAPAPDTDWDDVFEDVTQGWMAFTQQLRFALERHPNQPRRTLYLSGTPRSAGARTATAVLGLAALGAPGTRYSVAVPGESLAGEVWHRGRHQLGVSVDGWGDGLLVLLERPPSERRPRGGSQAIVTTYGLSDDQFADLERRWTELWAQHFEATAS